MGSYKFFSFVLIMALVVLHSYSAAGDDSSGFHGEERDALLALKELFNNSVLNGNWTGIMCYLNSTPYWQGIDCVNGRVTGIRLENMQLEGEIKVNALANLTELSTLSFRSNSLSGSLMDFTNNQKLTNIDLSGNAFHGSITSSLVSLVSLESLQLQDNYLTGQIPALNQSGLKTFNVSYNELSGEIPETTTLQSFGISSYLGNGNLCGPPTTTSCGPSNNITHFDDGKSGNKHNKSHLAAIIIGVDVFVLVIILILFVIFYRRYKKLKKDTNSKNLPPQEKDLPQEEHQENAVVERSLELGSMEGEKGKLVFMDNTETRFELDDLLTASAEGLGMGNFGNCYKAMMKNGPVVVVKRLKDLKPLSSEEFMRHVTAIAELKHPNLLPLLACYYSKDEKLFLYKFAAHGNVYKRLHGGRGTQQRVPFRWSTRLAVARSVAIALEHLHHNTKSQTTAPHGNLKSSNVLLNNEDEALVTDYGLTSLITLPVVTQRMISYKTPEYQSLKQISKKSDIWSYGCFLLELLTGRISALSAPQGTNAVDLCAWVNRAVREEWTAEIFDTEIAMQRGTNKGMLRLMQIAMRCCDKSPEKRPDIEQVIVEVEEVKATASLDEEDYSMDQSSLTDDSFSVTPPVSIVIAGDQR